MDNSEKQLKIQTGVLSRYQKEYKSYEKELVQEKARLDKFKSENAGEAKLKQQELVIQETQQMLPNVKSKILAQKTKLQKLFDDFKKNNTNENEQANKTEEVLKDAQKFIDELFN